MKNINNYCEIAPLKTVLLHRPGNEYLNLTPNTLERLLFDDIPYLKIAKEEHDKFAEALRKEGVEVVYLVDLTAEALDTSSTVRREFIKQFIKAVVINNEATYIDSKQPKIREKEFRALMGKEYIFEKRI